MAYRQEAKNSVHTHQGDWDRNIMVVPKRLLDFRQLFLEFGFRFDPQTPIEPNFNDDQPLIVILVVKLDGSAPIL